MAQKTISYMQIRGGSSKGVFLNKADLPLDTKSRDEVILSIMEGVGRGDLRQIDGLGGADSLTTKVAVVSPSERNDADLDYLFLQVQLGKGTLTDVQNCGNILAGVPAYAIETGILTPQKGQTTVAVHMVNANALCELVVETPNGELNYSGNVKVDGVPGTGSPIICNYLNVQGSTTGSLLPTGNVVDIVDGVEVTCIDNGMPVVLLRAEDLGITGYESKTKLDANGELKVKLENIRLQLGPKMNLDNVKEKTVPKMTLISKPKGIGLINTRTFIPHVCHAAIGVLGATSVASGCLLPGSIAEGLVQKPSNMEETLTLEHPSGTFDVKFSINEKDRNLDFVKSGVIRTARAISKGHVFIPLNN